MMNEKRLKTKEVIWKDKDWDYAPISNKYTFPIKKTTASKTSYYWK